MMAMAHHHRPRLLAAAVAFAVLCTAVDARQDERFKALEQQIDRIYATSE